MNDTITIGSRKVGNNHPPFIVAELSANHQGSLAKALQIIDEVAAAGADAVKLQTYTADSLTLDIKSDRFLINNPKSLWAGRTLYDLYQEAATPYEWLEPLFQRCKERGLTCFSSPFDEEAVDLLEGMNAPCYKIASLEIVDHALIAKCAATKKPLIISTGGATLEEIDEAVQVAREHGCKELILLKCTASYPADPKSFHLRTIPHLKEAFQLPVGLSDHSLGNGVALAAVALGACVIEKHVTHLRSEGGVDSAFSLEPQELKLLVQESKQAWQALGEVYYGIEESEKVQLPLRRSLCFVQDMKAGEIITKEHVRSLRPAGGLPPKYLPEIIGRKIERDVKRGDPVTNEVFQCRE